jgi:hypothetical protein
VSRIPGGSALDGVELPTSGESLEVAFSPVLEFDSRASDKEWYRCRDKQLIGPSLVQNPSSNVDSNTADVVASQLHLACVQSGADSQPQRKQSIAKSEGTVNGPTRTVESGEDAIAGQLYEAPSVLLDDGSHHCIVALQQGTPPPIAQRRGLLGRADDVGEQDRSQRATWFLSGTSTRQELGNRVQDLVRGR